MKLILSLFLICAATSAFAAMTPRTQPPVTNPLETATAKVKAVFDNAVVDSKTSYCQKDHALTCRLLVTYKDKTTGAPIESFRISFVALERMAGASEFYVKLPQKDRYDRFADTSLDGAINIASIDGAHTVLKTSTTLTIKNLHMPKLGTTQSIDADLNFGPDLAYLEGLLTENDPTKPKLDTPVRLEYPVRVP